MADLTTAEQDRIKDAFMQLGAALLPLSRAGVTSKEGATITAAIAAYAAVVSEAMVARAILAVMAHGGSDER